MEWLGLVWAHMSWASEAVADLRYTNLHFKASQEQNHAKTWILQYEVKPSVLNHNFSS